MPQRTTAGNAEQLFELYEQKMYRIAYAILNDEGQAEDAVIAAFEKIFKRSGVPRDPAGEEAKRLVVSAVRSVAIDQYRINQRERAHCVLIEDVAACQGATGEPCASPVEEHLERMHVRTLVEELPEAYGSVIEERFLNDHTVRQTAEILGISESNVRKRQERGLRMLREQKGRLSYESLS